MIAVSDKYKQAVKEPIRQISSFVELLVNGRYLNKLSQFGNITSNDSAEITVLDTVADDNPIYYNYASLEQDYFQLDGSFILPNRSNNKYTGFIGDINSSSITISGIEYESGSEEELARNKKCITLYFENGYATDFTITLGAVYGSGTSLIPYTFNNNTKTIITTSDLPDKRYGVAFKNISSITINVTGWSNPNHRVRIRQINLGETVIYKDKEIIEIKTNEQTDIYNLETPNNDCYVKLNNFDRKFNITDENNVLNRLNKNSIIRPYYGIHVDGCPEYICMGNYEFASYQDENNYYTSLNGIGNIENFESQDATLDDLVFEMNVEEVADRILENSLPKSEPRYNEKVPMIHTNFASAREQLQALSIMSASYIKQTREHSYYEIKNKTFLKTLNDNVVDIINKDREIGFPKFTKNNKMGRFTMSNYIIGTLNDAENVLFEGEIIPETNGTSYFYKLYIKTDRPIKLDTIKAYINNAEQSFYINNKSYYAFEINVVGINGSSKKTLKITAKQYDKKDNITSIIYDKNSDLLEINNNYLRDNYAKNTIANYINQLEKQYKFEADIMGDPSLEVGDTILLENIDGYKKGIITSIETRFNGGLTSTIKGECDNVL